MSRPALAILATLASACACAGCAKDAAGPTTRPAWTGPTDPLDVVLARINENNGRIATLAGSGTFLASLAEKGRPAQSLNGQITVLHTKPDKLLLRLNKDLAGDILIAGTNGDQFWLSIFGELDTTYYGTPRGPGATPTGLPLSPELIADVLGVATLNVDLLAQPVPTMRFNPDYDAYMLTWHQPIVDRWVTLREVWYDRATLEPRLIWLFDRDGRVVLRAKLARAVPMNAAAGDPAAAPRVARSFDLLFPETGSRLTFRLDELRARRGGAPNAQTYRFDPARAPTGRAENLDAAPEIGDPNAQDRRDPADP